MREVTYSGNATKMLQRMPATDARRIRQKVAQYAENPASLANNIKALVGSPFIRLRVGDWRVIMDDRQRVLTVVKIGPRGGVYE
jgi:mRNA interferase RelE/StbE